MTPEHDGSHYLSLCLGQCLVRREKAPPGGEGVVKEQHGLVSEVGGDGVGTGLVVVDEGVGMGSEPAEFPHDGPWGVAMLRWDCGYPIYRCAETRVEVVVEEHPEQRGEAESKRFPHRGTGVVLVVAEMVM